MKSFNKILISFFIFSLVLTGFLVTFTKANAQQLMFGQYHAYSVIFRGNGETIVYARIAITNPDEKPLTEVNFQVPNVEPTEFSVFQQKLARECVKYNYNLPENPCIEYTDPDYTQNYYYGRDGQNEYKKLNPIKENDSYKVTLTDAIESYKGGAIIVSYAAKGYVKESMGLFKFNFETIKVPVRVQETRVAVEVDSDLILKGQKARVNYETGSAKTTSGTPMASFSSAEMDSVVSNIGTYAELVKEAKNLSPNESFSVKGEYASSWLRLYLASIIWSIIVFAIILAIIIFTLRFLKNRHDSNVGLEEKTTKSKDAGNHKVFSLKNILLGLASAAIVIALTLIVEAVSSSPILYNFYSPVLSILLAIIVLIVYFLAIFGLAILAAVKQGWKALLVVVASELFWFVAGLIVFLILFSTGIAEPRYLF